MRITEILTEDQELEEGPLGKIGSAIGKGVGGLAKGVGAVAGGVRGAVDAVKHGYQVGRGVVGGAGAPAKAQQAAAFSKQLAQQQADDEERADGADQTSRFAQAQQGADAASAQAAGSAAQPATVPAPAAKAAAPAPSAQQINKQGPAGTAPAKDQSNAIAKQALSKATQAVAGAANPEKAGQTMYAQVKANINQLDKKGKQRILQLLQKSIAQPAPAAAAPAAKAAPATGPGSATAPAGPGAATRTEPDLNAPAGAEQPATAKKQGGRKKAAAPSQAQIDADRERLLPQTGESKKSPANPLAEELEKRVELHRRKMFETGLAKGQISIFRK